MTIQTVCGLAAGRAGAVRCHWYRRDGSSAEVSTALVFRSAARQYVRVIGTAIIE
jgi:uncharacterized protein YodC (DUF2158 family)